LSSHIKLESIPGGETILLEDIQICKVQISFMLLVICLLVYHKSECKHALIFTALNSFMSSVGMSEVLYFILIKLKEAYVVYNMRMNSIRLLEASTT
jgi:hypothetical protein